MIHLPHHFPHYFRTKLSAPLKEMYITVAMMDFASAAITLFEPLYLWSLHYSLANIMLYYILVYAPYFFLAPLGGKFVARYGSERSILVSTIWLVAYFAALIGIAQSPWLFFVAPLLFALQKTFYWPAYHVEFIRFSAKKERGSEFSALWTISTFMYVLGPIVGGFIVKQFGFGPMFIGAAGVIICSSWPLFIRKPLPKVEMFSYWKSLVLPFRRRYWRNTIGYLGLGEELIGMTIWSVFIMTVFGNALNVGLVVGLSALITSIVTLLTGRFIDRRSKRGMVRVGAITQTVTWLLRLLNLGPISTIGLDIAGRSSHNSVFVATTTLTYDRAHEDDYSWHGVYYEQGFALAKTLIAVLVLLLVINIADPFRVSFLIAALSSLWFLAL